MASRKDLQLAAGREVFASLHRAEPLIVEALAPLGVTGTENVVGFVVPLSVHVWLVTATDAERDALERPDPCLAEVRAAVESVGFPSHLGSIDGTVAQSQETVDRYYEGSWFYALR